jgi:CheY-like chemotaxis protein
MYFIFVSNDTEAVQFFEHALQKVDSGGVLKAVPDGYGLIDYLQNVKRGESYPDLIILTSNLFRLNGTKLLELLKIDDLYRLIPVMMLFGESNLVHEDLCRQLRTEFISTPKNKLEWSQAVDQMCTACS